MREVKFGLFSVTGDYADGGAESLRKLGHGRPISRPQFRSNRAVCASFLVNLPLGTGNGRIDNLITGQLWHVSRSARFIQGALPGDGIVLKLSRMRHGSDRPSSVRRLGHGQEPGQENGRKCADGPARQIPDSVSFSRHLPAACSRHRLRTARSRRPDFSRAGRQSGFSPVTDNGHWRADASRCVARLAAPRRI